MEDIGKLAESRGWRWGLPLAILSFCCEHCFTQRLMQCSLLAKRKNNMRGREGVEVEVEYIAHWRSMPRWTRGDRFVPAIRPMNIFKLGPWCGRTGRTIARMFIFCVLQFLSISISSILQLCSHMGLSSAHIFRSESSSTSRKIN